MKSVLSVCFFLVYSIVSAQVADKVSVIGSAQTTDPAPSSFSQEVRFHVKWNSSIGVPHIGSPGPGTYSGLMTIAPWSDGSGSKHHQINFNEEGLFWRKGTFGSSWEAWKKILTADESGNVGISNTDPQVKVDIGSAQNDGLQFRYDQSSSYRIRLSPYWNSSTDTRLDFDVESLPGGGFATVMSVGYGGNVGIGTIEPDAKLAVNGQIHTQEVRVDLTGAMEPPDYVFEKNYNLLSLAELEAYIDRNKHLPEVPSAKEIEENGLYLKEMNLLLLKKVEELTLHLIEQGKEIDKIKSELTQHCKP